VDRLDDRCPGAAWLHGLADFCQAAGEGRFADKRLRLALFEEFVFGDDAVAMPEQAQEHLKHLRFSCYHLAGAAQFMAVWIEGVVSKAIDHGRISLEFQATFRGLDYRIGHSG